jgi:hypothetical protein
MAKFADRFLITENCTSPHPQPTVLPSAKRKRINYSLSIFSIASPLPTQNKIHYDGGETARHDPNGFYHGISIKHQGKTAVLTGPPLTFDPPQIPGN